MRRGRSAATQLPGVALVVGAGKIGRERAGRAIAVMVALTGVCVGVGCPPPPPPVGYSIEIRSHGVLAFGATRGEPPPSWEWGHTALGVGGLLALNTGTDVGVSLALPSSAPDVTVNQPPVLGVLARDPLEMNPTLDAIRDRATWLSETSTCAFPGMAMVETSPPISPGTLFSGALRPLTDVEILPLGASCPTGLTGNAVAPSAFGPGEIRSIRTYNPATCHQSISHGTLTQGIIDGYKGELALAATSGGNCADAFVDFADSVGTLSYKDFPQVGVPGGTADPAPNGGFSLALGGHLHIYLPTPDIFATINTRYEYKLVDGRIGVDPASIFVSSSDATVQSKLTTAATTDLPDSVLKTFDQQMVAAPGDEKFGCPASSPSCPMPSDLTQCSADSDCEGTVGTGGGPMPGGSNWACLPSSIVKGFTCQHLEFGGCTPQQDSTGNPAPGITTIKPGDVNCSLPIAIGLPAAIAAGAAITGDPVAPLVATTTALDSAGNFRNWRCRRPTDGVADFSEHFRCEYRVDAVRYNVYPDTLDLVFFDHPDTSNEAYAFYVALVGRGAESKLCAPFAENNPRLFTGTDQGSEQVHFAANKNAFSCGLGLFIFQLLVAPNTLLHY